MKFKKIVLCNIVLISVFINTCLAQDDYRPPQGVNNWYIELGGSSLFYSANYEKYLYKNRSEKLTWAGRVGIGFMPFEYNFLNSLFLERNTFIVPFTTTCFYGGAKEKLEFGGGFTMLTKNFTNNEVVPNLNLGLRVLESNGVCFRITYTPLFRTNNVIHWIGVSFGKNFNFK